MMKRDGHLPVTFMYGGYLVRLRPDLAEFLLKCEAIYDIILFTAADGSVYKGLLKQVHSLIKQELNTKYSENSTVTIPDKVWSEVFYRDDCDEKYDEYGLPFRHKNITKFGRDLSQVIIVDDNPLSYRGFEPNAIRIAGFWGLNKPKDIELLSKLYPLLQMVSTHKDVRYHLTGLQQPTNDDDIDIDFDTINNNNISKSITNTPTNSKLNNNNSNNDDTKTNDDEITMKRRHSRQRSSKFLKHLKKALVDEKNMNDDDTSSGDETDDDDDSGSNNNDSSSDTNDNNNDNNNENSSTNNSVNNNSVIVNDDNALSLPNNTTQTQSRKSYEQEITPTPQTHTHGLDPLGSPYSKSGNNVDLLDMMGFKNQIDQQKSNNNNNNNGDTKSNNNDTSINNNTQDPYHSRKQSSMGDGVFVYKFENNFEDHEDYQNTLNLENNNNSNNNRNNNTNNNNNEPSKSLSNTDNSISQQLHSQTQTVESTKNITYISNTNNLLIGINPAKTPSRSEAQAFNNDRSRYNSSDLKPTSKQIVDDNSESKTTNFNYNNGTNNKHNVIGDRSPKNDNNDGDMLVINGININNDSNNNNSSNKFDDDMDEIVIEKKSCFCFGWCQSKNKGVSRQINNHRNFTRDNDKPLSHQELR